MIRTLGCPELPDPPICLRVGILHSRAVGIDVEVHLCSCFREAQHCGYFVCSLGGFLDAAAGMDTKPIPVRGSGSPRLPGSFPRVRGKRQVRHQGIIVARLIPACAGKTRRLWAWRPPSPAHPRACGENVLAASSASSTPGSSPRVRGKRDCVRRPAPSRGLIPARAGKTPGSSRARSGRGAHPRACGENPLSSSSFARGSGSSPRVRGKRRPLPHRRRRGRLIPARAGKTSRPRRPPPSRPAHPRACGENSQHEAFMYPRLGSSPRVRGKHPRRPRTGRGRGLIPARAGKTTRRPRGRGCPWAHPHACGENLSRSSLTFVSWGSSPRVRGKLP